VDEEMMPTKHLPLQPRHAYHTHWLTTRGNALAYEAVKQWVKGQGPLQFIIVGPCSKTFLAQLAAEERGTTLWKGELPPLTYRHPVVLDDANGIADSVSFFHWYNESMAHNVPVLYTASESPQHWPHQLPDLMSRLRTLPLVHIDMWMDEELELLLPRMMRMQGLEISDNTVQFALQHMERSLASLKHLVNYAHQHASNRRVTRACVEEFLKQNR
jgi:hypothetical protein